MAGNGDPESATDRGETLPRFAIEIVTQGWISSEPDSVEHDLCSHGEIRLAIGGRVIAPGEAEGDFTISTSALALLRTLESDHSPDRPVAGKLVMHCGQLLMLGCPAGIDWSVSHIDRRVRLYDVVVNSTTRFPGLTVEVAEDEYRRQIVAFAQEAKKPFEGIEKVFYDDVDRQDYKEFWQEYDARLSRAVESPSG